MPPPFGRGARPACPARHARAGNTGRHGRRLLYPGQPQRNGLLVRASRYAKNADKWVFGAEFLNRYYPYKSERIPVAQFTAEGGYYYKFLADPSRTFFFYLGGSALAGYESVHRGERRLYDGSTLRHRDRFLYGGAVTLEVDAYLTDRIILSLTGRERILWGTTTGHFHAQFGLGVKFIIH